MARKQDKATYLMRKDWTPLMKMLPREKLGDLMYAVICLQDGEEVDVNDPIIAPAFAMMKDKFDSDNEAYREKCETNAQIAKEREAKKKHESLPDVTSRDQSSPDVTHRIGIGEDMDMDMDLDRVLDKESLTGHKASCSEQSTEPTPDCDGLILSDGSEWWPKADRYKEYERCYPGVNVKQEFAKMRSWCLDNPKKRKTKNGIARFVNSWLSREQDSGKRSSPYMESIQNRVANVDDWSAALKEKLYDSG